MGAHNANNPSKQTYIGRFAPSPSGPLHYGSLIAAIASYLQAKQNNGQWLVRIEDIDPPREVQGAANNILRTLELYQFEWDQTPLFQSTRHENYYKQIIKLSENGLVYACSCSRKQIEKKAQESILGRLYPGTCRTKHLDIFNSNYNLRLRTTNKAIEFTDEVFGEQSQNLLSKVGDFIIYRKFDLPSFALAVTIDDAYQDITEVVRGHDLLSFTPLQIYLCQMLELPIPKFLHIPIITNKQGVKLSKQTGAQALPKDRCAHVLTKALKDLGQDIPNKLAEENLDNIWIWAIEHWNVKKIPAVQALPFYLP